MTTIERVWLRHRDTGGYFECPVAAVADWRELGFEPSDPPPPPPNPVVAERIGWEQQAEQHEAAGPAPEKQKSTPARRSAATEQKEPTDG